MIKTIFPLYDFSQCSYSKQPLTDPFQSFAIRDLSIFLIDDFRFMEDINNNNLTDKRISDLIASIRRESHTQTQLLEKLDIF